MGSKYDEITDKVMVEIDHLSKVYHLYDKPIDRLKEAVSLTRKCYYREYYALKDLSLVIRRGESVGIIGVNGSGKSTLLKIITGVLNPSEGKVRTNGKIAALLELGAGFNPEYTGLENIYLNGTMMGRSEKEMKEKLRSIIDFADIGEFINQPVKSYSSGMFARLAFAVSINVEPEILIVDEALSVGDMRFQIKCMDKMKSMMQGGTTVLFVSHDINSIRRFCTRAVWLRKGEVEADGDVNEISDMYMDFLKMGEENYNALSKLEEDEKEIVKQEEQEKGKVFENTIAEIFSFKLFDERGDEVSDVRLDQPVSVEMLYKVYETDIEKPVAGVAIRGMDDDYVCGLNTLLDKRQIPWEAGENRLVLSYPHGILAVGGQYYFDIALYDQTATVPIHYISVVKKFTVHSGNVGEGRYIMPHEWR